MAGKKSNNPPQLSVDSAFLNSDSAPALPPTKLDAHAALKQAKACGDTAAAIAHNANKASEYGEQASCPYTGAHVPAAPIATGSSLSEGNDTGKTGEPATLGLNRGVGDLAAHRADASDQVLTTNQGVPVADNQHSLKAGLRGPALLKDFVLREKLTHFDHERIPERIVHARGSAAHGYFESYADFSKLTAANLLNKKGKKTPVFVRFSPWPVSAALKIPPEMRAALRSSFTLSKATGIWWAITFRCSLSKMR